MSFHQPLNIAYVSIDLSLPSTKQMINLNVIINIINCI
ncbi:Putative uncharacterized protein [Moritella viscosa]|uniref:Uncharacterized protein n=1 Tax=Moritella viscosa TaxID=80854 RepID=A0A1K9Z8S7_9GAMM|nr:Putative uncharacterized protein [Moritella viscosa]SHO02473.1 Putative uncharacterized protein [Moritella viscosa]SHO02613.1 Putative uncharacterized protein [Moritella viscosa]SHO03267.1 Putative uncharacterized protein [Moritella viscosa]SHO19213.1 Putative uncharacterized protein [Moritella viscosa]